MIFTNPLNDPLFFPALYRMAGLLALALIILIILNYSRHKNMREDILFKRWRTWAFIAPIYFFGVVSGLGAITLLITVLTFQGLREYTDLVKIPKTYRQVLLVMGIGPASIAALTPDGLYLLAPLLLIAATLQPLLFGNVEGGVRHLAFATLGWGYIAWFLAHIILIYEIIDGGRGIILAIGVAVALSDIGAFTLGNAIGRHKMSPRLSPNKTFEGAIGNFLGAYAGMAIMSFALPVGTFWTILSFLPLLIGIGAIWGDLMESAIKREFQVKDAGTWLPGFGGLLDRIDSLIIVAPLVFYFLKFIT